jgi:NAD(P)-dependent dehydrogenase (short-subunit alcohol dehydrogenase family)
MDAKAMEQIAARIPWKRRGTPKDIATVATFLCSEKAEYITGQILVVDGGWTLE